jgi:hypothetical protein
MGGKVQPDRRWGMKTRTLLILSVIAGLAILIAFTLQITLAAR